MAMLNAWSSAKKPWSYPDVTDSVRGAVELRSRLLPYLYTAFADYYLKGIPAIRAMILEGGGVSSDQVTVIEGKLDGEANPYAQAKVIERNDQFMFGPSIMVAPFYESQSTQRKVQLPGGKWFDFYTGRSVGSDTTITVTAEQTGNRMPLFVKEGAVIPMLTQAVSNTEQAYGHDLELRLYGQTDGSCTVYEDDGKTFNYMTGQYALRKIQVQKTASGKYAFTESRSGSKGSGLYGKIAELKIMGQE